jgi:hypothetical protein
MQPAFKSPCTSKNCEHETKEIEKNDDVFEIKKFWGDMIRSVLRL